MAIHEKTEHIPSASRWSSPAKTHTETRAETAEAEVARLQEELARLQARSNE